MVPGALSITAGKQTNWFVSPLDGVKAENSPKLLLKPAEDFVLSAKVTVDFQSQWDAGTLVLYANDTVWAKLCFEMSIEKQPTIVSVVTRGLSDDNNSIAIHGNSVYLKIAKVGQGIFFYASTDGKKWTIIRPSACFQRRRFVRDFLRNRPRERSARRSFQRLNIGRVR